MSMKYCPIMSTLGYVLSPARDRVLLSHRIARQSDDQYGKFNGLGGHMEPSEDIASCMIREIREEAGIEVTAMSLRGTVNWTGFGSNKEDWAGLYFSDHRVHRACPIPTIRRTGWPGTHWTRSARCNWEATVFPAPRLDATPGTSTAPPL